MKKTNINMNETLTQKTLKGFFWLFAGSGAQMFLQFIVLVLLARLLTPEDFGISSAALVVVNFSIVFSMLGVGPALIQRKDMSERHLITGFTVSVILNTFIAILLYVSSDLIASFFNISELSNVLKVMSIVFVIQGITVVPRSMIQRSLNFKLIASIELFSYLAYGVVGTVMAFCNFGVWALVGAFIAQICLQCILTLIARPHKFKFMIYKKELKDLLNFGTGYSLGKLGNQIALEGDNLIIGKILGPEALGLYSRAYQLMVMPAKIFGNILDRVLFPSMSQVQHDNKRLRKVYRRGVFLVAFVMLPVSTLIILLSTEIVLVLFGHNWTDLVIPLQILAMGLLFRTSYKISDSLANAKGAVYRRALRHYLYASLVLTGSIIGAKWGLIGVSYGVLVAIFLNYLLMAQLCLKLIKLSWSSFLKAHVFPFILSALLGCTIWIVKKEIVNFVDTPILIIIITLAIVAAFFIIIGFIIIKCKINNDILWMYGQILNYVPKKFSKRKVS